MFTLYTLSGTPLIRKSMRNINVKILGHKLSLVYGHTSSFKVFVNIKYSVVHKISKINL